MSVSLNWHFNIYLAPKIELLGNIEVWIVQSYRRQLWKVEPVIVELCSSTLRRVQLAKVALCRFWEVRVQFDSVAMLRTSIARCNNG
jgi:hypothetical protein